MTDTQFNDPDQVEPEFTGGSLADAQETPEGDRIDSPDDDDVDYEDENSIDAVE